MQYIKWQIPVEYLPFDVICVKMQLFELGVLSGIINCICLVCV